LGIIFFRKSYPILKGGKFFPSGYIKAFALNCESELKSNPFRENYPLISCLNCAIPVKMSDKKGILDMQMIKRALRGYLRLWQRLYMMEKR